MSKSFKINLLVAYPYMNKSTIEFLRTHPAMLAGDIDFILDSGAFTAWKAGKDIKLDDYLKFVDSMPFKPWNYFALDVVGNPEATLKNYDTMLERGYNSIPVFTRGEDLDVLEYYYSKTDYVAIGGLVGTLGNHGFVKSIMQKIKDRKVHLLGYTSGEMIKHFKPYTIDSSSWTAAFRYAALKIYEGQGIWHATNKKKMATRPSEKMLKTLDRLDIDYMKLSKQDNWTRLGSGGSETEKATARSYVRYAKDLQDRVGTKYFFACTTGGDAQKIIDAYYWLKNKYGV